jgi:hypothetical protein
LKIPTKFIFTINGDGPYFEFAEVERGMICTLIGYYKKDSNTKYAYVGKNTNNSHNYMFCFNTLKRFISEKKIYILEWKDI